MSTTESPIEASRGLLSPGLALFAAVGVCLGLNDVWRLPALVLEHGSLWFPVLYLAVVLLVGLPLMTGELALARLGCSHPAGSFGFHGRRDSGHLLWPYAGIVVLTAVFLILCYSVVVAAWMMAYAARAAGGALAGASVGAVQVIFQSVITDAERLMGWYTLFVLALAGAAARGVHAGLGRLSLYLVAAVFVLVAASGAVVLHHQGAGALVAMDWSFDQAALSGALVRDAVVQAFFTLGVCMGAMLLLGGYLPANARLGSLAAGVVALDVLFVALACVLVMPLVAGGEGAVPRGVTFAMETLPLLMAQMPGGRVFLAAFYVMLLLLVATTALVLMEVLVAWWSHRRGCPRSSAVTVVSVAVWSGGLLALLSFSMLSFRFDFLGDEKNFGLFDVMDILSSQILLPIIGILMAVFVGWHIDRTDFAGVVGWGRGAAVVHFLKRYLVPLVVAAVLLILVFGRVIQGV